MPGRSAGGSRPPAGAPARPPAATMIHPIIPYFNTPPSPETLQTAVSHVQHQAGHRQQAWLQPKPWRRSSSPWPFNTLPARPLAPSPRPLALCTSHRRAESNGTARCLQREAPCSMQGRAACGRAWKCPAQCARFSPAGGSSPSPPSCISFMQQHPSCLLLPCRASSGSPTVALWMPAVGSSCFMVSRSGWPGGGEPLRQPVPQHTAVLLAVPPPCRDFLTTASRAPWRHTWQWGTASQRRLPTRRCLSLLRPPSAAVPPPTSPQAGMAGACWTTPSTAQTTSPPSSSRRRPPSST